LATQSWLAFLPLIGKVSFELSREPMHNWEKALLKEQGLQPVHKFWIDAIKSSSISKFSPSIHWGGVRGHPSISLLPLSSPTLHLFICITPPHLCTIFKDHT
jgi:hypothetical protein